MLSKQLGKNDKPVCNDINVKGVYLFKLRMTYSALFRLYEALLEFIASFTVIPNARRIINSIYLMMAEFLRIFVCLITLKSEGRKEVSHGSAAYFLISCSFCPLL